VNAADGQPLRLSCSIGVCTLVPSADAAPHAIVQTADQALLRAKQEGRRRVVEHGGEAHASASAPAMSEPASVRPHAQDAPDLAQVGWAPFPAHARRRTRPARRARCQLRLVTHSLPSNAQMRNLRI
jgi:hypothetical protein